MDLVFELIAVASLALTCFSIGYALGLNSRAKK